MAEELGERLGESASETVGEVERIGIGRSWEAIGQADAVLFLHDLTRLGEPHYDRAEAAIAAQLPAGARVLHVFTKTDLAPTPPAYGAAAGAGVAISARTGAGLAALRAELLARAGWQASPDGVFIARSRHVQALKRAQAHLALAADHAAQRDAALDLLAEELRLAHDALGEITGRYSNDDLLGDIFSRFCIGK
jgi:tRNA modification GTPase